MNALIVVLMLALLCLCFESRIEPFVNIDDAFGEERETHVQKKYDDYVHARDNPLTMMKNSDGGPLYDADAAEEEKVDCGACSWKVDNFCVDKDGDGNLVFDSKCAEIEHVDQFGVGHKSKGYMCSAWGTDLGFEECNSRKCKQGTLSGCPTSELPNLTKKKTINPKDVSGTIETFNGCKKVDGVFRTI